MVVAAGSRAGFNYFMYRGPLGQGNKINLRAHVMFDERAALHIF